MKPFVNIAMACLLFTAPAAATAESGAPAQSTIRDYEYRACVSQDECVSFSVPCDAPIAINRQYRTIVESWYDYMNDHVSCSLQLPDASTAPVCRDGRCVLAP